MTQNDEIEFQNAPHLVSIGVENFKSYKNETIIPLKPLTILIGANNSGKSSLLQPLLLLKQTLKNKNQNQPISLDGFVNAINLKELTHGSPKSKTNETVQGPILSIHWTSPLFIKKSTSSQDENFLSSLGLEKHQKNKIETKLSLHLTYTKNEFQIQSATLQYICQNKVRFEFYFHRTLNPVNEMNYNVSLYDVTSEQTYNNIIGDFNSFIPYIVTLDYILPNIIYDNIFEPSLNSLKKYIDRTHYLSSNRENFSSLYKYTSSASNINELGVSGEFAAHILQSQQHKENYSLELTQLQKNDSSLTLSSKNTKETLNQLLHFFKINKTINIHDIEDIGFQILLGKYNLNQSGKGLNYLIPILTLGLMVDPQAPLDHEPMFAYSSTFGKLNLNDYDYFPHSNERIQPLNNYIQKCRHMIPIIIEESESHLHPKVQSYLAYYFVSQAMMQRQMLIETHSDHLVRKLRSMIAHAPVGSFLERWLQENVVILEVTQDEEGCSHVVPTYLTREGGLSDHWPTDFMDEAEREDKAIFYAALDKQEQAPHTARDEQAPHQDPNKHAVIHDEEPEPEEEGEP